MAEYGVGSVHASGTPGTHCRVVPRGISLRYWRKQHRVGARQLPRKLRQLKADLRRAGFYEDRTSGSHVIWKHPLIPGVSANIAGNDGDDAKRYQEQEVRLAIQAAREAEEKERQ